MLPEVGVPSIEELVLSEVEGGQAHRHGIEAPRDFESIPQPQAISHHFQTLKNQLLAKHNLEQLGPIWIIFGFNGYTLVTHL